MHLPLFVDVQYVQHPICAKHWGSNIQCKSEASIRKHYLLSGIAHLRPFNSYAGMEKENLFCACMLNLYLNVFSVKIMNAMQKNT